MTQTNFGTLLYTFDAFPDGSVMTLHRNGNQIHFVIDNKIEKTFHTEDIEEITASLLAYALGEAIES